MRTKEEGRCWSRHKEKVATGNDAAATQIADGFWNAIALEHATAKLPGDLDGVLHVGFYFLTGGALHFRRRDHDGIATQLP